MEYSMRFWLVFYKIEGCSIPRWFLLL